jgi:hypothetical protein
MLQRMQMENMKQALRKLAAEAGKDEATADAMTAKALKDAAEAAATRFQLSIQAGMHGMELGAQAAHMEAPL